MTARIGGRQRGENVEQQIQQEKAECRRRRRSKRSDIVIGAMTISEGMRSAANRPLRVTSAQFSVWRRKASPQPQSICSRPRAILIAIAAANSISNAIAARAGQGRAARTTAGSTGSFPPAAKEPLRAKQSSGAEAGNWQSRRAGSANACTFCTAASRNTNPTQMRPATEAAESSAWTSDAIRAEPCRECRRRNCPCCVSFAGSGHPAHGCCRRRR